MKHTKKNEFLERYQQEGLRELRYRGIQEILVSHIKGSVNRWQDFDQRFKPVGANRAKLMSLMEAAAAGISFPPIQVYQVKDDYYVIDGNHRTVVAKDMKQMYIDAEVWELLPPGDSLDHLLWREKSSFALQTDLNLNFTGPGLYQLALKVLREYQHQLQKREGREITLKETSQSWNREVYQPAIALIHQSPLNNCFSGHTLDDLFLYIFYHQTIKAKLQGREVDFKEAMAAFLSTPSSQIESYLNKFFQGFVLKKKCTQLCGQCVSHCPEGLICLENGQLKIDEECLGCGRCTAGCPEQNLVSYGQIAGNPTFTLSRS